MQSTFKLAILEAVKNPPAISHAAITGSYARPSGPDQDSDVDVLLVASDIAAVRQVHAWLPTDWNIPICAFHLTHYCTVLLDDFEKL